MGSEGQPALLCVCLLTERAAVSFAVREHITDLESPPRLTREQEATVLVELEMVLSQVLTGASTKSVVLPLHICILYRELPSFRMAVCEPAGDHWG